MSARLDSWYVYSPDGDGYLAPECRVPCLRGVVTGHHRKADGTKVTTSPIALVDGLTVMTDSGTLYILGEPDPTWLAWMVENGIAFDPLNPIRMVSRP